MALYLTVPVGCVWLYNQPEVNALIKQRVSRNSTQRSRTPTDLIQCIAAAHPPPPPTHLPPPTSLFHPPLGSPFPLLTPSPSPLTHSLTFHSCLCQFTSDEAVNEDSPEFDAMQRSLIAQLEGRQQPQQPRPTASRQSERLRSGAGSSVHSGSGSPAAGHATVGGIHDDRR